MGDFTIPPWEIEMPCQVDRMHGLFYFDIDVAEDKDVVFKFKTDSKHWCLSALYDVKQDVQNCEFFNNLIRSSPLITVEELSKLKSWDDRCLMIA